MNPPQGAGAQTRGRADEQRISPRPADCRATASHSQRR